MTIWKPDLEDQSGPRYVAIANALAAAVEKGELRAGAKLPPQRDLADELGVTTGTVTRAYAEAARRGLVRGEVGRGTYVLPGEAADFVIPDAHERDETLIDLSLNVPVSPAGREHDAAIDGLLSRLTRDDLRADLFDYQPSGGTQVQRRVGASWLEGLGLDACSEQTLLALGGQHALNVIFSSLCRPGDVVVSEGLTYAGMRALAHQHQLRLIGLPFDDEGLRPDALDQACRTRAVQAIYCVPTLHNPTTATMSQERRAALAAVAREHGVAIVEDDVHGPLLEQPPRPLASHAPELTYYVSTLSKCIAPGLRVAYVHAPAEAVARLDVALRTSSWMPVALMADIASRWIEDGTAERLIKEKRIETRARQALAAELLAGFDLRTHRDSPHAYLHLPEPWRGDEFSREARQRGVAVSSCSVFLAGRTGAPFGVRLGLGCPRDRADVERALVQVAELLVRPPTPSLAIV